MVGSMCEDNFGGADGNGEDANVVRTLPLFPLPPLCAHLQLISKGCASMVTLHSMTPNPWLMIRQAITKVGSTSFLVTAVADADQNAKLGRDAA